MPPVESYQRTDIQKPEESSRQINNKSIDQTRSEARIENRSVRDTIEDSVAPFDKVAATDTTVGQSEVAGSGDSNDSVEVLTGKSGHYWHAVEKTGDQVGDQVNEVDFHFPDSDIDVAASDKDAIEDHLNHTSVSVSGNGSTRVDNGASNNILAQQSIKYENHDQIDSVDNLTVEQAFDFLSQQTDDDYVQPSTFATRATH